MQNHHFWRNECQRYRVCKSKSGHFAWEVLAKSLTFILTQKSKKLDFDDPCHENTTSKGRQNPTLMSSRPSRGALKRYQKIIENLSKNLSFSDLPKSWFLLYIYIAFWGNPPASHQQEFSALSLLRLLPLRRLSQVSTTSIAWQALPVIRQPRIKKDFVHSPPQTSPLYKGYRYY